MKTAVYTMCLFLVTGLVNGQQPKIQWEKTIGGTSSDYLYNAVGIPDDGFLLVGSSTSAATGDKTKANQGGLDYFIWKMDAAGHQEWQQSFGGDQDDYLTAVSLTNDGGYLLAGSSFSTISGDKTSDKLGEEDLWLIKLDAAGYPQWQKTIGGSGVEQAVGILPLASGGFLISADTNSAISGTKQSESFGAMDYWVVQLDPQGNVQWEQSYGGLGDDHIKALFPSPRGYVFIGESYSPASGNKTTDSHQQGSLWLVEIDFEGNILHQAEFLADEPSNYVDLKAEEDGWLLSATTWQNTKKSLELLHLNSDFSVTNRQSIEIPVNLRPTTLMSQSDGLWLFANQAGFSQGKGDSFSRPSSRYLVSWLSHQGDVRWQEVLKNEGFTYMSKAFTTRDGGIVLMGNSNQTTTVNRGLEDFYLVKLTPTTADEKRQAVEIYPIPTRDYINVLINEPFTQASVELFDLHGRKLKSQTLYNRLTPVDVSGFPSGVYLLVTHYDHHNHSLKIIKK